MNRSADEDTKISLSCSVKAGFIINLPTLATVRLALSVVELLKYARQLSIDLARKIQYLVLYVTSTSPRRNIFCF